jgi:ABC-type dipeptide/oligopeptide/nickel transport system ATPase component
MTAPVLDITDLVVSLGRDTNAPRIIDGVSVCVYERETLCLVGESGSGKSVTSLTVMGLLQPAHHDRDGAGAGTEAAHRGRTDHRA